MSTSPKRVARHNPCKKQVPRSVQTASTKENKHKEQQRTRNQIINKRQEKKQQEETGRSSSHRNLTTKNEFLQYSNNSSVYSTLNKHFNTCTSNLIQQPTKYTSAKGRAKNSVHKENPLQYVQRRIFHNSGTSTRILFGKNKWGTSSNESTDTSANIPDDIPKVINTSREQTLATQQDKEMEWRKQREQILLSQISTAYTRLQREKREFEKRKEFLDESIQMLSHKKPICQIIKEKESKHQPPEDGDHYRPDFRNINPFASPDEQTYYTHMTDQSSSIDTAPFERNAIVETDGEDSLIPVELTDSLSQAVSQPTLEIPKSILPNTGVQDDINTQMDLKHDKPEKTYRIVGQNANGVLSYDKPADSEYVPSMQSFVKFDSDLVLLNETNIAWHRNDRAYEVNVLNKALIQGAVKTVVSCTPFQGVLKGEYLSGGTMSVAMDRLTTRINKTSSDKLGRWTKMVFQAKGGSSIAVYNVYRTNKSTVQSAGPNTAWMMQYEILSKKAGEHDPRVRCIIDLIGEIHKGIEKNELPIILGDFNEDLFLDNEQKGLQELMQVCDLEQACQHYLGHVPSSRGNNRSVYHILVHKTLSHHIIGAGICPDEVGFVKSDHRAMYVDLSEEVLDTKQAVFVHRDHRILQMANEVRVEKYINEVTRRISAHNIIQRLAALHKYLAENGMDDIAKDNLEYIDAVMTSSMLQTEQSMGYQDHKCMFSAEISDHVEKMRFLRICKRRQKNNQIYDGLYEKSIKFGVLFQPDTTVEQLDEQIKACKQEFQIMQDENIEYRESHMNRLHQKAALQQNKTLENIIKIIQQREKQSRSWIKINSVTKQKEFSQFDKLGLPAHLITAPTHAIWKYLQNTPSLEVQWEYITDLDEIEKRLIEWNDLHFKQADETAFGNEHWKEMLDPEKFSDEKVQEELNKVLRDNDGHMSIPARELLKEINSHVCTTMQPSQYKITCKQFRYFYKRTPEKRSSSPSGLHISHWKALARDEHLSNVWTSILEICLQYSYTLERWKEIVSIMLEKEKGKPKINRLRMIHLVETDFNFIIRLIWGKNFVYHNEKQGSYHSNQYGGRKGQQGQSAALNKKLTLEVTRHFKTPMMMVDKDAKACYDRILGYLTVFALRRMGMPIQAGKFMTRFLQEARYKVRTAKGISEGAYQCKYGTGQGLGWSPPNWSALSDTISCIFEKFVPGMKITDPQKLVESIRNYDAYIDDVNGGLTQDAFEEFKGNEIIPACATLYEQANVGLQYYSELLEAGGGALNLAKCFAYMLTYAWSNGKWRMLKNKATIQPFKIHQSSGLGQIEILNPQQNCKMLGVYLAPDGKNTKQIQVLKSKAQYWGRRLQKGYLNKYDVDMGYKSALLPKLEYPLGVTTITEKDCNDIIKTVNPHFLNKLGIVGTMNRSIMYGPFKYGGLNYSSLYTTAGIKKIQMFIGHQRRGDQTAKLQKIALNCAQQWVGLADPILTVEYERCGFLSEEPSWIHDLWKFLGSIQGKSMCKQVWTPPKGSTGDINLMEAGLNLNLSQKQLQDFNAVRLHKRVYYLSEVVHLHTMTIRKECASWKTRQHHDDKFPWMKITKKQFNTWMEILNRIVYQIPDRQHLGEPVNHAAFEWVTSREYDQCVFRKCYGKCFRTYERQEGYRVVYRATNTYVDNVDPDAICVVTEFRQGVIVIETKQLDKDSAFLRDTVEIEPPRQMDLTKKATVRETKRFQSFVRQTYPNEIVKNLGRLSGLRNFPLLAKAIGDRNCIAVGDASVMETNAAHGYVFEDSEEINKIEAVAPISVANTDANSTRAERFSVLAMVSFAHMVTKYCGVSQGEINIYCDNDQALHVPDTRFMSFTKMVEQDMDMKLEIKHWLTQSNIKMNLLEVKGHMDSDKKFVYEDAPQQVKRNIDVDEMVKSYMETEYVSTESKKRNPNMPHQTASLMINESTVAGDLAINIREKFHGEDLKDSLVRKLRMRIDTTNVIHWDAILNVFQKVSLHERVQYMKVIHSYFPTNVRMRIYGFIERGECLRCSESLEETWEHVLACPCREAREDRRLALSHFLKQCQKCNTSPLMQRAFAAILRADASGDVPDLPRKFLSSDTEFRSMRKVFWKQLKLGIGVFKRGILLKEWETQQNIFEKKKKIKTSRIEWSTKIVKAILEYSLTLWKARCQAVHATNDDSCTLTQQEAIQEIKRMMNLNPAELSSEEKHMHNNINRYITKARESTILRWLQLLRDAREAEIQRKRTLGRTRSRMRPLTDYFD